MSETYTNITPEQARKLSQEHTNWQEVCQQHIDNVVPEACKLNGVDFSIVNERDAHRRKPHKEEN